MNFFRRLLERFRPERAIDFAPRPLLHADSDLMVVWSPKSACTATYVWFAAATGRLADLEASGLSPHEFRRRIYGRGPAWTEPARRPLKSFRVVHVARDPASRAVSSYRHALRTGYEDERFPPGPPIGPLDRQTGFSFLQFLDYLGSIDLAAANGHHRVQWHPVEDVAPPELVIDISRQDLFTELNRLAATFGLAQTDFAAIRWLHEHEKRRAVKGRPFETDDVAALPLDAEAARGRKPWPSTSELLTPEARRRIRRLYAVDYERLGLPEA